MLENKIDSLKLDYAYLSNEIVKIKDILNKCKRVIYSVGLLCCLTFLNTELISAGYKQFCSIYEYIGHLTIILFLIGMLFVLGKLILDTT